MTETCTVCARAVGPVVACSRMGCPHIARSSKELLTAVRLFLEKGPTFYGTYAYECRRTDLLKLIDAALDSPTDETFVQPSTKSAKNACFQAELQTDQRLNESTTNERPCHGCEHQIPWDWVFCAWCGFENDSPALKANEPPAVELWYCPNCKSGNRVDFHHTSCPACGRLRAEKNGLSAPSEGK